MMLLYGLLLVAAACSKKEDDETPPVVGDWTIEEYIYQVYDSNTGQITDIRQEDAGDFQLRAGGTGTANLLIPGFALPPDQPINWIYAEQARILTIDYDTGQDPFVYEVDFPAANTMVWTRPSGQAGSAGTPLLTTVRLARE